MYLGWGRGSYRKWLPNFKEPFIDPGQATGMPLFPRIFWGKAPWREAWLKPAGFPHPAGCPGDLGVAKVGKGDTASNRIMNGWQEFHRIPPSPHHTHTDL